MKKFFRRVGDILGFTRNSDYVRASMNENNLRSGLFMSFIIVGIEIWMIVRQLQRYLIPGWALPADDPASIPHTFASFSSYTVNFFLMLIIAVSLFFLCLKTTTKKFSSRALLYQRIIPAALVILITALFFIAHFINPETPYFEKYRDWTDAKHDGKDAIIYTWKNILLILLYLTCLAYGVVLAVYALSSHKKGKDSQKLENAVLMLFAAIFLIFGIKVSYSDFVSSNGNKEIMCFLTMMLYVGCLLIWRPYISVLMLAGIPIIFYQLLGTLSTYREFYDGDRVNYITFFISLAVVALSTYFQRLGRAKKDEALERIAHFDELTGLHNYSHFQAEVKAFEAKGGFAEREWVYVFANVSAFQQINESRGFVPGDEVLRKIALILKECFPEAFGCRESADHFVMLTPSEDLYERMEEANAKVQALDAELSPSLHFGFYVRKDGEEPRRAVDKARYAMNTVKNAQGYAQVEYDKEMHARYRQMQYVIHHIDEAAAQGHIQAFYQPVVDAKTRRLVSVEALCRWMDPEKGMLSPATFVSALENAKLIHKLDKAMIDCVLSDIAQAKKENRFFVPVSINFSRLDFELMDAIAFLEERVAHYGLPKEVIHVEVTESALAEGGDKVLLPAVKELRKRGYEVWLDDFGSGYSSLNVLKDYDFNVLKIDMQFLVGFEKNMKIRPVLRSIVQMAKDLGMGTVTEGVESSEQADYLASIGCDRLQGFLIGKPMRKAEFFAKVNNGELITQ